MGAGFFCGSEYWFKSHYVTQQSQITNLYDHHAYSFKATI